MLCVNALHAVLDVGRVQTDGARKNNSFLHGLVGRTGFNSNRGKGSVNWKISLDSFFEELKEISMPFATRIVRKETGTTKRDNNPNDVMLPPHLGKRKLYAKWCWD